MTQKISAFFQHWPPYSGAAALRGLSIICGLRDLPRAQGTDLRVYTTTQNTTPVDGVEVVTLPVPEIENSASLLRRILGEIRIGWVAARQIIKKSDRCKLVIISMPAYLAGVVLSVMARRYKVPYVLELRDVYPQVYAEAGLIKDGSVLYRVFSLLSRRAYEGAKCVVTATRGLEKVVRSEAPKANVHCVYNGFPAEFLSREARKHERFTACFHGVLGFFQDIDTLIAVARRLQAHDIDVVVIGYGRQESLLRNEMPANLSFRGRLPFDETIAEIEQCHVGLCLRKDDGISKDAFPVKTWEYLGLGIPSIVTPKCEAGIFLEAHGCGVQLESGRVEQIAAEVIALKEDAVKQARFSQSCRAISASYTREELGARAAEIIFDSA